MKPSERFFADGMTVVASTWTLIPWLLRVLDDLHAAASRTSLANADDELERVKYDRLLQACAIVTGYVFNYDPETNKELPPASIRQSVLTEARALLAAIDDDGAPDPDEPVPYVPTEATAFVFAVREAWQVMQEAIYGGGYTIDVFRNSAIEACSALAAAYPEVTK